MNKKTTLKLMLSLVALVGIFTACSEDDPAMPTISLSETLVDVKAQETVETIISYTAEAGAESITVTKYWDGVAEGTPEVFSNLGTSGDFKHTYTVQVDDADHVVKLNYTIVDNEGQVDQKELVLNVELTSRQLLLKYDWLLSDEVRVKTGESDIQEHYTDDVYRFNADGTYQKSIGDMADAFNDIWYKHCTWELNDETGVLKMHRTGAFGGDAYDVITVTIINHDEIEADVTYLGLDVFNTGEEAVPYEAVEEYIKKFSSLPKGSSFDPYAPGADDDVEGPSATPCNPADFDNN